MEIVNDGHLCYCTNIHPGETWDEVMQNLSANLLEVKKSICNDKPFAIGLRLSNQASEEILLNDRLEAFKRWMDENDCYVITMNGFPYGGFHDEVIKDKVHYPDWTTVERLDYTKRLAYILSEILPDNQTGGISTSPLSYRWWHQENEFQSVKNKCTKNLVELIRYLHEIKNSTGKSIHIDIEPEPDGLLETGTEFLDYYEEFLLGQASEMLKDSTNSETKPDNLVKEHIQLCYDVCHFAVEYENPEVILKRCNQVGVKVGKIQISAALKVKFDDQPSREAAKNDLQGFVEPYYLHQAVLADYKNQLFRFKDLDLAIPLIEKPEIKELRTHYHVPIFTETYGSLDSTQDDISSLLEIWKSNPFSQHLEVETYTWGVLPEGLKKNLNDSIARELRWVLAHLNNE